MWSTGGSSALAANDEIIVTTHSSFGNRVRVIDRATNQVIVNSTALESPRGVVLTGTGEIIIADASTNRLVRLVGEAVEDIADGLKEPVDVLLENDTSVLVTEMATGTISRVSLSNGTRTELVSGLHDPRGIARLPDGRVVVVEPGPGSVTAIDLDSGQRTELARGLPISIEDHDLPDNATLGIAVTSSGAIYVSCGGDNSIVKITLKAPPDFEKFSTWLAGQWDNVAQTRAEAEQGFRDADKHPRYAMDYVAVDTGMEGQVFAIHNYGAEGLAGELTRVSLHHFFPDLTRGTIIHEFLFLKEAERWGDLGVSLTPLAALTRADINSRDNCRMYWRERAGHFVGRTEEGACVTQSFTDNPIRVEGYGELWPDRLVRHDMTLNMSGRTQPRPGGETPEVFDRITPPDE